MKHILRTILWVGVCLYLTVFVLLKTSVVQGYLASQAERALAETLDTKVQVSNVDLRLFNRAVIDGLRVYDKQDKEMLRVSRVSASIDILPLFYGKISISSAQLFGMAANIYKNDSASPLNCQFVIDALQSNDTTSHTPLDLRIASLIIRNSSINYDQLDKPKRPGVFSTHHLGISKLSAHIILNALTDDSLHLDIHRMSMVEQSGLEIKSLKTEFHKIGNDLSLKDFHLELPNTSLRIPYLQYTPAEDLRINTNIICQRFTTADIQALLPKGMSQALPSLQFNISAKSSNNTTNVFVKANSIDSKAFTANLSAQLHDVLQSSINGNATISNLHVSEGLTSCLATVLPIPNEVKRLGDIDVTGTAHYGSMKDIVTKLAVSTSRAGKASLDATLKNNHLKAALKTPSVDLAQITDNSTLGPLKCDINVDATLNDSFTPLTLKAKGKIDEITYATHRYSNIALDALYTPTAVKGTLDVADDKLRFRSNIDIHGLSVNKALGHIDLDNIYYRDPSNAEKHIALDRISISSKKNNAGLKEVELHSDLCDISLTGTMNLTTLPQSIINVVARQLPNIPGISTVKETTDDFHITAKIYDVERLKKLVSIPLTLSQPITIDGDVTSSQHTVNMRLSAPDILVNETQLTGTEININTPSDDIQMTLATILHEKNGNVAFDVNCSGKDNNLHTTLSWDNQRRNVFKGSVKTLTEFYPTMGGGRGYQLSIPESFFQVGDTLWCISSRNITYDKGRLNVEHFMVDNDRQRVVINGVASKDAADSITVDLTDIDISYILNLVNFHSVEFSGMATGRAQAHAVMGDMKADADLVVKRFQFQYGNLGDLSIHADYSNASEQIAIKAHADDPEANGLTLIDGYVSPQQNCIDLDIQAKNSRLEFMQSFCSSFINDTDLHGTGRVRLYGPFNGINLGGVLAVNGALTLTSTNCRYFLDNDTVTFVPNDIRFDKAPLKDQYGNVAYLSGGIHHRNLGRMTYDLSATTDRFFAYNFPTLTDGSIFCGKAFVSGEVGVHGKGNELLISADCTALDNSYITYNASSPDAIKSQEFITWRSANDTAATTDDDKDSDKDNDADLNSGNNRTNIRMNFLVNATPQARLHLIMDANTGDYIDLFGSGVLRVNYYNKGAFEIFGNYGIDHGTYKMTIQNLIRRDFTFLKGGVISFGGDPYDANLNMQAQYTLNSVSLADLNIGSSFKSNNVPVNCLMNITGKPSKPVVDFNLNLPTLGSDARQMVYSLINSEEEMTQQVLYLLAVGRFYAQNNANTDMQQTGQGTLAMQSFLSTTLSQQFNNIMSSVLSNVSAAKNWSFGANIAPGNEGLSNAEYEGLLSGRMLNNRLIFNGQFGYRDNIQRNTQNFIGDFNIQYLLTPNGTLSLKAYNQSNDRYFTKSSLNTQGIGILLQKEFGK